MLGIDGGLLSAGLSLGSALLAKLTSEAISSSIDEISDSVQSSLSLTVCCSVVFESDGSYSKIRFKSKPKPS